MTKPLLYTREEEDTILKLRATFPPTKYKEIAKALGHRHSWKAIKARHKKLMHALNGGDPYQPPHQTKPWPAHAVFTSLKMRSLHQSP